MTPRAGEKNGIEIYKENISIEFKIYNRRFCQIEIFFIIMIKESNWLFLIYSHKLQYTSIGCKVLVYKKIYFTYIEIFLTFQLMLDKLYYIYKY